MFAQKHPHRMMKNWPASGSNTRVAHMPANSAQFAVAIGVRLPILDNIAAFDCAAFG